VHDRRDFESSIPENGAHSARQARALALGLPTFLITVVAADLHRFERRCAGQQRGAATRHDPVT